MTATPPAHTPRHATAHDEGALPLAGWTLVSLRPVGGHAGLRRAARRRGARLLACSPLRLAARPDQGDALRAALAAPTVVFTSPAAVRFATQLASLPAARRGQWLAVGAGTAGALARAGIDEVAVPTRMDSEGLLDLPALARVDGARVGLVTAPGGRGLIARTLIERGAQLQRAEVYRREPVRVGADRIGALAALDPASTALVITSGEAFGTFWAQLDDELRGRLCSVVAVSSSDRLAAQARQAGFRRIAPATSARPDDLLAALTAYAVAGTFG